jgi:uncharacterized caspase-like protein
MLMRRDVLAGGLFAGLSVNAFAQSVNTGSRMALVVGNSEYKSVPLKSPARDAAAMAEVLAEAGFAVTQAQNLTEKRFQLIVEEFARKVAANKALGLVYLAGQGMAWLCAGISALLAFQSRRW